jgi:signal recognition particle GTPase
MPDLLTIPAELTPLLRRAAIDRYQVACERAAPVAHECLKSEEIRERSLDELLVDLLRARIAVRTAEDLIEMLADDVETEEEHTAEFDSVREHEALLALIDDAIEEACRLENENEPTTVILAGRNVAALQALRTELAPAGVTA